jgi:hypothetical protein
MQRTGLSLQPFRVSERRKTRAGFGFIDLKQEGSHAEPVGRGIQFIETL